MKYFNPKVSIVIPVYNGAKYLGEAIDSALAQTYKNIEIIVANDGSNDNGATEKVAKSYGDKIIYLNQVKNGGASTVLNLAIKNMTGEYFSWLSHDDLYFPNKIKRQVEELSKLKNKNTIMLSDLDGINERYEKIYQTNYIDHINEQPSRAKSRIYPVVYNRTHGCTLLIPKVCFDEVGLFDPKERVAQDFEFFNRAFSKFPSKLVPETLVRARDTSNRMGRRAKPRASIEYSRLYIEIIENLSEDEIKALAPDRLTFYYDMRDFFKSAGYDPALKYINDKITAYLPVYSSELFYKLIEGKIKLGALSKLFSNLSLGVNVLEDQANTTDSVDLIFYKIVKDLSSKEVTRHFSGNLSANMSVYDLFMSFGYKRTAAYIMKNIVCCLAKNKNIDALERMIYKKMVIGEGAPTKGNNLELMIRSATKSPTKPRLLFCSTHWLTGGMERVMSNLFQQLHIDYDIYLITPFDGRMGSVPLPSYVNHIKISNSLFYSNFDGTILSYAFLLDISVVIGFYNMFGGQLDLYQLCSGTNIKTVASNHEYYFYPYKSIPLFEMAKKRLEVFHLVDAVLWPTNFSAALYGLSSNNSYVLANPNTYKVEIQATTKKDDKVIICVGRFNDYIKRVDRILKCFALVLDKEPEAKLVLLGKCDRRAPIKQGDSTTINDLMAQLHIDETSITFTGEVDNVSDYYKKASLLLLTSSSEGFGMVINEAACFGVPSVCNYFPGIEDLVIDGENGYISEQDDIESMVGHICQILSDSELQKKLGEKAKILAEKFSAREVSGRWKYLMSTLLENESNDKVRSLLNKKLGYKVPNHEYFSRAVFEELNVIHNNFVDTAKLLDLDVIYNSRSWKITKPLRLAAALKRSLKDNGYKSTAKKTLKKVHKKMIKDRR